MSMDESRPQSLNSQDITPELSSASQSSYTEDSCSMVSWIAWNCSLPGLFLDIDDIGLNTQIPMYSLALDMILDLEDENNSDSEKFDSPETRTRTIEEAAQTLYNLIHQRFVLTRPGLSVFKERYEEGEFGVCPRTGCGGALVVPCGLSDIPGVATLKMYCPRCNDVYQPRQSKFQHVDGCSFGTTFAPLLFVTFPELVPKIDDESVEDTQIPLSRYTVYTPKSIYIFALILVFGFRVSEFASNGPKMGWLRWKEGLTTK
ncbi:casein kinase 2 regulatory subunit [Globomyces sp. JEL0801]|nr:casein kinase 2 regulatory subunit [Globomyces sp. JEL0801]